MQIEFSPKLAKGLKIISKRNPKLFLRIHKQLQIFQENPQHPSLRLHRLAGNQDTYWSISINMSIRMVYKFEEGNIYFFKIGTHEQVYK